MGVSEKCKKTSRNFHFNTLILKSKVFCKEIAKIILLKGEMMEKTDFLDRIARGLAARGLAANTVNKYVRRVGELLDELSEEERAAILSHDISIDAFVDDLLRGSDEGKKEDRGQKPAPKAEQKPAQRTEARPEVKKAAQGTDEKAAPKSAKQPEKTERAPKSAVKPAEVKKTEGKSAPAPKTAGEEKKTPERAKRSERAPTEEVPIPKNKKRKAEPAPEQDPNRDYTRFWTVFWLTSPVWALILFALAAVFVFMIVTFAAMSVVFVALLIAAVVLGLALSLVGIIYGTVQLFGGLSLPVGLFELGQGIFIGGLATVLGVLLYNLSVRFSPWLIKQAVRMFVSSLRWVKQIFYVVKGALAK